MFGLLAALSFMAASYAASKLAAAIRRRKGKKPGNAPGGGSNQQPDETPKKKPIDPALMSREEMLEHIVRSVQFSEAEVVRQEKVGDERRESPWPADDIEMRPIRSFSEMSRILPSGHALDDDMFYGLLAAKQLAVRQDIEEVGIFEERRDKLKKVLLVVQDVSGSMSENSRDSWAVELNQRLIARCVIEDAGYGIQTFNSSPADFHEVLAGDKRGFKDLENSMSRILAPGGGTDIDAAITAALDQIKDKGYHEVRMVLVTDGTVDINTDEVLGMLKSMNVHLHTVCIAGDNPSLASVSNEYNVLMT